jgi:hypothetical protein
LAPRFRLDEHGPFVAIALASGYVTLGRLDEADALLDALRLHSPPEAAPFIAEVEAALVARRVEQPAGQSARMVGVPLVGPVWSAPLAQAGLELAPGSAARLVAVAQLADCTQDRYTVLEGPALGGALPVEEACRSIPLMLSEGLTLATTATGMALLATHGTEGLVSLREPLSPEAALELASPRAIPRVLITGFFSRAITSELQLDLTALNLVGGGKPISVRVSKGTPAELAVRAQHRLIEALALAGVLDPKPSSFTRPDAPDARYLDVTHRVLALVLAASGRLDKKRLWGVSAALEACERLALAEPFDTCALLFAAAHLAAQPQSSGFKKGVQQVLARYPWSQALRGLA